MALPTREVLKIGPSLTRRRALALAGAAILPLVLPLTGCETIDLDQARLTLKPTPLPAGFNLKPLVDVHCHVFNIQDIPASEFAKLVFLEDSTLANVIDPLVELVVFLMRVSAPTVEKEMKRLPALSGNEGGAGPDTEVPDPEAQLDAFLKQQDGLHGSGQPIAGTTRTFPAALNALPSLKSIDDKLTQHQRFLVLMATDPETSRAYGDVAGSTEGGGGPEAAAGAPATYQTTPRVVSGPVLQGPTGGGGDEPAVCKPSTARDVQNAVRWVFKLTKYRFELLLELQSLIPADMKPPTNVNRARLMTPSLVDYDFWLKDDPVAGPTPSSIADQVKLMAAIAKVAPTDSAVHCFVPFDPLRHAWQKRTGQKPNALDVAREAVEKYGAIGIKIYPPMGYKPMGNCGESDFGKHISPKVLSAFKDTHELGCALDESLGELFTACTDPKFDVPVFTHCSNSQGSFPGAALRAGPDPWLAAFKDHKTLRVNLAHAGGPWCLARLGEKDPDDKKICSDPQDHPLGWFETIVATIATQEHPNLYFDIADFDMFMKCDADKKLDRVLNGFIGILEKLSEAKRNYVMDRMMYGTDWILLGRTPRAEFYFDRMRDKLVQPLETHFKRDGFVEAFFSANPLRFLGLWRAQPEDKSETWKRLENFYKANGRDGMLERIGL